jgi:hypothetical protein
VHRDKQAHKRHPVATQLLTHLVDLQLSQEGQVSIIQHHKPRPQPPQHKRVLRVQRIEMHTSQGDLLLLLLLLLLLRGRRRSLLLLRDRQMLLRLLPPRPTSSPPHNSAGCC